MGQDWQSTVWGKDKVMTLRRKDVRNEEKMYLEANPYTTQFTEVVVPSDFEEISKERRLWM